MAKKPTGYAEFLEMGPMEKLAVLGFFKFRGRWYGPLEEKPRRPAASKPKERRPK